MTSRLRWSSCACALMFLLHHAPADSLVVTPTQSSALLHGASKNESAMGFFEHLRSRAHLHQLHMLACEKWGSSHAWIRYPPMQ